MKHVACPIPYVRCFMPNFRPSKYRYPHASSHNRPGRSPSPAASCAIWGKPLPFKYWKYDNVNVTVSQKMNQIPTLLPPFTLYNNIHFHEDILTLFWAINVDPVSVLNFMLYMYIGDQLNMKHIKGAS